MKLLQLSHTNEDVIRIMDKLQVTSSGVVLTMVLKGIVEEAYGSVLLLTLFLLVM